MPWLHPVPGVALSKSLIFFGPWFSHVGNKGYDSGLVSSFSALTSYVRRSQGGRGVRQEPVRFTALELAKVFLA